MLDGTPLCSLVSVEDIKTLASLPTHIDRILTVEHHSLLLFQGGISHMGGDYI